MLKRILLVGVVGCATDLATVAPVDPAARSDKERYVTDAECARIGGHIETEQTYAYLSHNPEIHPTPYRFCRIPSPKNEQPCGDDDDCAGGHCYCTGDLARPNPSDDPKLRSLDGTPGTGACYDGPRPHGSWYCMVEHGTIRLAGIIID
jgi:hypothetical protein